MTALLRAERLAALTTDDLALVTDALALVGFGGTDLADFGGKLADLLLVGAGDDHMGGVRDRDGHARRRLHHDLIGEADLKGDSVRLLQLGLIADTDDFEPLRV